MMESMVGQAGEDPSLRVVIILNRVVAVSCHQLWTLPLLQALTHCAGALGGLFGAGPEADTGSQRQDDDRHWAALPFLPPLTRTVPRTWQ
jgi:hypothetical protein